MKKNFDFSTEEKEKIEHAIQSLEKESSGEIVLYFAKNSDNYIEACWKSAAFFSVAPSVLFALLSYYWLLPEFITPFNMSIIIISFVMIGGLIPLIIPKTRLSFVSDNIIYQRALTKARDMFLQEEIFNTKERTGILIYISKFEHIVEVLGDSGINKKITQKDWDYIVGLILNGIKNNKHADGIVQAIDACKKLLIDNGFNASEDNTNEISNEMRIE